MEFPQAVLLVFAKAPIAGEVKTRLIPALGRAGAASVYEQLARQTLDLVARAALAPVSLWCSPTREHPFFEECREAYEITLHVQQGGDLGERMASAMEQALAQNQCAVLIGCDCPVLTREDLREAFAALKAGSDAVLGPAEDGGYVLIGLRRPVPELFADMPWGSGEVLAETRARLRALGLRFHELPERWDVDRFEDLIRLLCSSHTTVNPWMRRSPLPLPPV